MSSNNIKQDGEENCMPESTEVVNDKAESRKSKAIRSYVKTLQYAHDIEERLDGRSLLSQGFAAHRGGLLQVFGVQSIDDLDGLERESVRRLMKRRIVRELSWGRIQTAYERAREAATDEEQAAAVAAYDAEVIRFDAAIRGEETTEARLDVLLKRHLDRTTSPESAIQRYIRLKDDAQAAETAPPARQVAEAEKDAYKPAPPPCGANGEGLATTKDTTLTRTLEGEGEDQ